MQSSTRKKVDLLTQKAKPSLQPLEWPLADPSSSPKPKSSDICHHIDQELLQLEKNLAYLNFAIKELNELNRS